MDYATGDIKEKELLRARPKGFREQERFIPLMHTPTSACLLRNCDILCALSWKEDIREHLFAKLKSVDSKTPCLKEKWPSAYLLLNRILLRKSASPLEISRGPYFHTSPGLSMGVQVISHSSICFSPHSLCFFLGSSSAMQVNQQPMAQSLGPRHLRGS